MKTIKTFLAILIIASLSTSAFAKQSLLQKAKESGKKVAKNKKGKGKGTDKMAVKGSGVPKNTTTTATPAATTTVTPSNK
ncbi:MAG: hypothetical protein ACLQQ4_06170 [Bacteroidia bacterium]